MTNIKKDNQVLTLIADDFKLIYNNKEVYLSKVIKELETKLTRNELKAAISIALTVASLVPISMTAFAYNHVKDQNRQLEIQSNKLEIQSNKLEAQNNKLEAQNNKLEAQNNKLNEQRIEALKESAALSERLAIVESKIK